MSIPKQPTIPPIPKTTPPKEGNTVYTVVKAIYDDNRNVIDCEVVAVCRSEKKAKSYIKGFGYDSIVITADWGNQNIYIALVNDAIDIINIENFKQL